MALEIFNVSIFQIADKWLQNVTALVSKAQEAQDPFNDEVFGVLGGLYGIRFKEAHAVLK